MKKLPVLLLMLSASVCFGQQMPSKEQLFGEALKDFGNVTGGLHLDQKCHVLSEPEAAAFKDNVAFIRSELATDLGDGRILDTIQASAQKVATSDKYSSCGVDSQMIIKRTAAHAHNWSGQIKKIKAAVPK